MANRLQQLLMGGAGIPMPSVARSAMVEQLLSQAARQPIQAGTPIEGINIASKQILAALLARREQKAQQAQAQQQQQALAQALGVGNLGQVNAQGVRGAGIAPQPGGVRAPGAGVPAGMGGGSPQQQSLAAILSGLNPEGTQGMLQVLAQQAITQPKPEAPAISRIGQRVVPGRYFESGESQEHEVFQRESPNGDVGMFIIQNGRQVPVEGVSTPIERTETGGPGDFNAGIQKELDDAEFTSRQFVDTATEAIKMLDDTPDVNTFVARAAGWVNDLQANVTALARNTGIVFEEASFDPDNYAESFDSLGIENRRMQSIITTLAFQRAAAQKQTGQTLSNRDVERFITEIGADSADPRAFKRVLADVAQRTERGFRTFYEIRANRPFDGDMGSGELVFDEPAAPPGFDPRSLTDEELQAIINGQ